MADYKIVWGEGRKPFSEKNITQKLICVNMKVYIIVAVIVAVATSAALGRYFKKRRDNDAER